MNFIPNVFLKITCLCNLGMSDQTNHLKNRINLQQTLVFISMQKINFFSNFFLEILQNTYYFEYFWHTWPYPLNMMASTFRKPWCLSGQKINLSLTSLLRYCKDFANFLLWVLWAWLAMPTRIDSLN